VGDNSTPEFNATLETLSSIRQPGSDDIMYALHRHSKSFKHNVCSSQSLKT
jgi:hypothetical protein